jgi:hypothetical protein
LTVTRHVDPLTGDLCCLDAETLSTARIPGPEALRTLRQQTGRCPWCGFDLDHHADARPCPEPARTGIFSAHGRSDSISAASEINVASSFGRATIWTESGMREAPATLRWREPVEPDAGAS